MEDLTLSISQYEDQLSVVKQALQATQEIGERESLLALQSELQELINLTRESLDVQNNREDDRNPGNDATNTNGLDDEYALFMKEMAETGAYEENKDSQDKPENSAQNESADSNSDIEDELSSLLGMKCAVYHTHTWGGKPSLHNAMVSSVVPRQDDDQFNDLQVKVLFTHPTHAEMLPCPFYLNGDCKFSDDQCRYSHGAVVKLSDLKEAIEPNYNSVKIGSRILLKLKPPDDEDMSTAKKSTEKYHLWHIAIVKGVDIEKKSCVVKLEHGVKTGEKRKTMSDEHHVMFEEIFPLSIDGDEDTDSDDSLSDTEYPESKTMRVDCDNKALIIEKSLQNNAPAMGGWEQYTRGMGSKIMLSMGYVPGTGLGAASDGRLQPVEARSVQPGRSLDHCMELSEKNAGKDPLKVEQKLKKLQKREEERNKRAYEREKEREKRNVFNFLNNTLGDKPEKTEQLITATSVEIKQSTSKDLNIEKFKLEEDCRKIENEILKLQSTLPKYPQGTSGHRSISIQIAEKNKELNLMRNKEKQIVKEQKQRKDAQKMTVF
ncbi:zinc finger CCCH-type with G patch domain-containing protein isoform X1 [Vanessa atalanta]|uniref:zinc finger CCCH-type with G patch domain-containing protein isoform X1 n=1 Tax=Vanessa atalanta TaxID=42275 RepID=UPI001FCCE648|nr:zinc finger CCCH-type with G patch domain-containing protein isoform X1 [Vanessa atalanta]